MVLPEGIISFEKSAFLFAYLKELNFPTTLETIGGSALRGTEISQFVFPQGLKTIGLCALSDGNYDTSIIIPSSVTSIGSNFANYNSTIVFEGSTYDLLNYDSFGTEVSSITLLLPKADDSKAYTVKIKTTFDMGYPMEGFGSHEIYPKAIYYGWKNSEIPYENATVEDKLNTNNYEMLYY